MRKSILAILLLGLIVGGFGCLSKNNNFSVTPTPTTTSGHPAGLSNNQIPPKMSYAGFSNFSSEYEMKKYLLSSQLTMPIVYLVSEEKEAVPRPMPMPTPTPTPLPAPTPVPTPLTERIVEYGKGEPLRYSQTNVQVKGIDEPDIVKTDGKDIFYSMSYFFPYIRYIPEREGRTISIKAFPPEDMSQNFEIKKAGNLLLYNDVLVIISYNEISAYSKSSGNGLWNMEIDGSFVAARLYGDSIYLITSRGVDYYSPCPIKPITINGKAYEVKCIDIYHPPFPSGKVLYSVFKIDPESGDIEKSINFIGNYGSTVYMSENAIYVAYNKRMGEDEIYFRFLNENQDLLPKEVLSRIEKVMGYDISSQAKMIEIQNAINEYLLTLNKDERLKFENDFWNRMQDFRKELKREITKTYIVKLSLALKPVAENEVPGRLLNQFSMDEYNGYLRVATTLGDENDLYVLNGKLEIAGKITGFGKDERIYAVRFIGERGYIVTFRETDPFFVIDLSDPANPEIKGELKIPGFSSYLHPINDTVILGVGREGSYVKISMFDVSDAENPEEIAKYTLKESWSEVLYNHHAFLIDSKHRIFFLPAGNHGYVFSYSNGIELVKAVSIPSVRALYIDDYLYIIGDSIAVYDENTWDLVKEFKFE